MGRNAWDSDQALASSFRTSGGARWGRVLAWILIIGAATFVCAYYLPLHLTHRAVLQQQQEATQQAQVLGQKLRKTEQQLAELQKNTAGLVSESSTRERARQSAGERLVEIERELGPFTRQAGIAVAANHENVRISIEHNRVFRHEQAEVTPQGRNLLCEIAKIGRSYPLRIAAVSDMPAGSVASSWALTALQAGNIAQTLEQKCRVAPDRLTVAGYGRERAASSARPKLAGSKIEIEIRFRDGD
jgi:flagellar motor protein MotB